MKMIPEYEFLGGGGGGLKTGLSPPVKYLNDRSKAVLFVELYGFFTVLRLLCLCARLFICALWSPARKGLNSWLSFVVFNREFITFSLVSWVYLEFIVKLMRWLSYIYIFKASL